MISTFSALIPAPILLASNGGGGGGSAIASLIPFLLIGVAFYFLIIRPQRKRQQEQQAMLRQVSVGDEVVTIGGFHGTITSLDEDTMRVELSPGVEVTMARNAISRTLTEPEPFTLDDDDEALDELDDFDDDDFDDDDFEHDEFDDGDGEVDDEGSHDDADVDRDER